MEGIAIRRYDAIIVGVGQAGKPLAKKLSGEGWKIAVVEREKEGGSCINYGCTPSKAMISSAETAYLVKNSINWGINVSGNAVDFDQVVQRRDRIVENFKAPTTRYLEKNENIDFYRGTAAFTDTYTLQIKFNDEEKSDILISADKIFLNTGTEPDIPDIKGLTDVPFYTAKSWIDIHKIPEHLAIIGGGNIGLEFAQMFSRLGSKVSLFQELEQLLPREDEDIAREMLEIFWDQGIDVHLNVRVESVYKKNDHFLELDVREGLMKRSISVSHLLIATGTRASTASLNLRSAGIKSGEKAYIKVNERLETSVKGIYAMGDCKGGPEFTHISYDDYRIVSDQLFGSRYKTTRDRLVPYTLFTDPQLGRIGLNEKQCRSKNISYRKAVMKAEHISRATETNHSAGLIKVLIGEDDKIIGASVLLSDGGEVASVIQVAMMGNLNYQALRDTPFSHPTWSESLNNVFQNIKEPKS